MPRSYGQRLKLLYLLDYFRENSNEDHVVKSLDILDYFDDLGIHLEQKTLQTDIHLLQEYGYEIQYDARNKGHHLVEREFELQELQLLIDSIQSSRFITQRQAKSLTDKLKAQASKFDRAVLDRRCYVANRVRSKNDSIFYYIDDIHYAIANDLQISFRYFSFNPQKEKVYYKKGQYYTASPYALLWNDNNYYLLAFESNKIKHFRVDKLDSIKLSTQRREGKAEFSKIKLSERSLRTFSMYSGKEKIVKLKFSNHLAGVVIDRFGRDIEMVQTDDRHFMIQLPIEISDQFYGWLCGLGGGVRIISPTEEVEKFQKYLQNIMSKY